MGLRLPPSNFVHFSWQGIWRCETRGNFDAALEQTWASSRYLL